MTQAGLQVPEEVDVKGISDNAYSKCMAEKEKGPAGSAKVAQKAPPKGSPQGKQKTRLKYILMILCSHVG